jgi:hypothetical protein
MKEIILDPKYKICHLEDTDTFMLDIVENNVPNQDYVSLNDYEHETFYPYVDELVIIENVIYKVFFSLETASSFTHFWFEAV